MGSKYDYTYIEEAVKDMSFYCDVNNTRSFFVQYIGEDNCYHFDKLNSEMFRAQLYMKVLNISNDSFTMSMSQSIEFLHSNLISHGDVPPVNVYTRIAGSISDYIEYDLGNGNTQCVHINEKGWEIKKPKNYFLTPSISLPQVTPVTTDKKIKEMLKPFINLEGDEYLMFIIWLIQCFSSCHHYGLLVMGDRGSGKSFLGRIISTILDPGRLPITKMPHKIEDLLITLENSFLVCFDNVGNISNEISDTLCGAITESTYAKRKLFTDNGLSIGTLSNTVVLNGIDVIPTQSDFAERFIVINPKKLKTSDIRRERDIWAEFNALLPEILGAIFDILSKAMIIERTNTFSNLERMADAFSDSLCIALAMGISEHDFRKMYAENFASMQKLRAQNPIVEAVSEYMNSIEKRKVSGLASEIYSKIRENYSGDKKLLPGSASHFSRKLQSERDALSAAGYEVNRDNTGSQGCKLEIIRKK